MTNAESPILIVSDLHLGSMMARVKELRGFLEHEPFHTLILNGDILDSPNLKFLTKEHWDFLHYLEQISKNGKEVIWISGNHDGAARELFKSLGLKTKMHYLFDWNGKRCLVIHGHQYDKFLIQGKIMATTINRSYRIIQKIDRKDKNVSRFVKTRYKLWLRVSSRVAKGAIRYGTQKNVDYVFCGHTHEKLAMKLGRVNYLNSGSWSEKDCHYIILKDGEVKIGTVHSLPSHEAKKASKIEKIDFIEKSIA